MSRWKIIPGKSTKDLIKQPEAVKLGVVPPLNSRLIMVGCSGSGKSVLLSNLVVDKRFYNAKKTFDHIFLISPTCENDCIQKGLNIDERCIVDNLDDAAACLESIMKHQKESIKKAGGSHKAPLVLVLLDDVIGHKDLLNSREFTDLYIKGRHYNVTSILCSQHLMRVPRVVRLQATALFIFACSRADCEIISESYCPPMMAKKAFLRLIDDATRDRYSFLSIFMNVGWEKRFRRNLDEVINLDYYRSTK
jgi:hypothetical protein